MPKNNGRSKAVVNNDATTEKGQNDRTNPIENTIQPVKIVSMAINQNGVFFGLGDDGKVYRLADGYKWETLQ
jgi:hypothetical protein